MPNNINAIKKILSENQAVISSGYKVKKLGVFGSVARGENKKSSDIDMLVEFSEPVSFFLFLDLENFLSSILGKKVDLTTRNALKPVIKKEILKEAIYV